jgi:hypothetical protein
MEAEILAEQEAAPAFDPGGFPATDPYIAELEAQLAAEQAPAPPVDLSAAAEMSANFDAMAQQYQGAPDSAMEAEMMGEPPMAGLQAPEIPAQYIAGLSELDGPPVAPQGALEQPHALTEDGSRYDYSLQDFANAPANPEYDEIAGDVDPSLLTDENLAMRAWDAQKAEEKRRQDLEIERDANDAKIKERDALVRKVALEGANQKTEDLFAQAKALAAKKIDKDRYVKDMSWGQKAAGFLSILAGGQLGLLSGRGGNEAMQFFLGEINRDIEEQKYNLESEAQGIAQQQGLVADIYRQTGDIYTAAETARAAVYEAATAEIESQMAKVDPMGSQYLEREVERRAIQSAAAAHQASVHAQMRKNAHEDAELEIKALNTQSQIDERAAKIKKIDAERKKLERRGTGTSTQKPKVGSVAEQERLVATGYLPYKDANGLRIPAPGEEAARLRAADPDAKQDEREPGLEYLDTDRIVGVTTKDGKPVAIEDEKTRTKVRDVVEATQLGLSSLVKIRELLTEDGREAWGLSKEQAKAEGAKLLIAAMAQIKGPVSDKEMPMLKAALGFDIDDPMATFSLDKMETRIKRVESAIEGARRDANTKLKSITGREDVHFTPYNAQDNSNKNPKKTQAEDAIDSVIAAPDRTDLTGEAIGKVVSMALDDVDKALERGTGYKAVASDRKLALERMREGLTDQNEKLVVDAALTKLEQFMADPTEWVEDQNRRNKEKAGAPLGITLPRLDRNPWSEQP